MSMSLDLVFLEVNSLEESLAFYEEQLGFEVERRNYEADPPTATLRAGSFRITLVQQIETMLRRGRGVHFFVGVPNVDELYQQLLARKLVLAAPVDEGWGGRFITLVDPDKYRLFFVTWTKDDREE